MLGRFAMLYDIEIDKEFTAEDRNIYKLNNQCNFFKKTKMGDFMLRNDLIHDLITGKIKPVWKPNKSIRYYTVNFAGNNKSWETRTWYDTATDELLLKKGLVFETREEAIKAAETMLESLVEK